METRELCADGLVTVAAAAQFLSLSRSAVYALMDRGELCYAKLGRARRIPKRALEQLAATMIRARGGGQ